MCSKMYIFSLNYEIKLQSVTLKVENTSYVFIMQTVLQMVRLMWMGNVALIWDCVKSGDNEVSFTH